jgi:uncharacterized protein (DUF1778 family)
VCYRAAKEIFTVASIRPKRANVSSRECLELCVAPQVKQVIRRAMAICGLTAGDLADEGARRVLDEHERMVLAGADREAFLEAVLNPPEPTKKLVAALRRHRDLFG